MKTIIHHHLKLLIIGLMIPYNGIAQTLYSSNLPIVIINTNGQTIKDEPKVMANMKIIYNGTGVRNNVTDAAKAYNGKIGIEYRGSSSQMFPKKPMGFETWNDKGEGIDASILGMPAEQDWILFTSYNEKSLIHNMLAMKMARDMGMYASRTKHVEVIVNDRYEGVYVLMEKIKRNSERVNISKLSENENTGDALTGGYIFKVDKTTGSGGVLGWNSKVAPANSKGQKTYFQYEYPKPSTITAQQQAYLRTYLDSADAALNSTLFLSKTQGYRQFFDASTFAKFLLINEVSRNVDGYRISTYFHKDKHSKDRRIKAGPAWDFDLGFGNADYCNGMNTYGWAYLFGQTCPDDYWQVPFYWKRMLEDPEFVTELGATYTGLRKTIWKTEKLHAFIDSVATELNESQARNFQRWPILGQYIWPNPRPVPTTWKGEVEELKYWLNNRLSWMDTALPGVVLANEPLPYTGDVKMDVLQNPIDHHLNLRLTTARPTEVLLELVDVAGRNSQTKLEMLQIGENNLSWPVNQQAGSYFLRLHTSQGVLRTKIVKK